MCQMQKLKSSDLRRNARVAALQSLFAADVRGSPDNSSLEWLVAEDSLAYSALGFAQELLRGVSEFEPVLNDVIRRYAPAWPVNQLPLVDRNILRIAIFELMYTPDVPQRAVVNEAVELAKTFGSDSSARFVNGVLGSVLSGLGLGEITLVKTAVEGR